jgi:uncharacterized protein YndB with AHSA1/START domain
MIRASWKTRIDRPAADVFDYLADLENEPSWNPDASNVVRTTDGAIGVGTTWEEDYGRIGHYVTRVDRYDRPSALAFDARNPKTDAYVAFSLAPAGEAATDVSCEVKLTMHGFMRVMEPFLSPMIRRQIETERPKTLGAALSR